MNTPGNAFIRLAGACAMVAPLLLLVSDIMMVCNGGSMTFNGSIVSWISMLFMVPAIIGLIYIAAERGGVLPFVGGVIAFFGAMAGASMQVLFRVWAVLEELGTPQTVTLLKSSEKLITLTQKIGLTFPIGLIILAICLFMGSRLSRIVPLALIGGAVLFPIGRIFGSLIGYFGGDLLFILAFGLIGKYMLTRPGGEDLA